MRVPLGQRASRRPRAGALGRLLSGLSHQRPGHRFSRNTNHETRNTAFFLLALAGSLVLAQAAWGAAFLTGTVSEQDGSDAVPLPGAYVQVKAGSPERVVAQAATDSRGRYLIEDVPEGRVTLGVVAEGCYTVKAGGLDSETITRTCPQEGECGSVDFLAARAGVLEGYLNDDFGGPVQGAEVTLTPAPGAATERLGRGRAGGRAAGRGLSDDRGYFRIWGLKPGRYLFEARMRFLFPGWLPKFRLEAHEVEIAADGEPREVSFQLRGDAGVFSISGIVERLTDEEPHPSFVIIRPRAAAAGDLWAMFIGAPGGKFRMDGLEKGDYVVQAGRDSSSNTRETRLLAVLTVDRDLMDLRLRPSPPTGVRGRVTFADGEKSNLRIRIYPRGTEARGWEQLRVEGPDYAFEHGGLPPGEYSASLPPGDRYLVEHYSFTVHPGSMTGLEMAVSSEFAKVRGTVRLARGGGRSSRPAGAHFLVGLRGLRGSFSSAADENGVFAFDKVIPGEYRIAAWREPDTDVSDEEMWAEADSAVRTITVEAGFEMEVDLTAER